MKKFFPVLFAFVLASCSTVRQEGIASQTSQASKIEQQKKFNYKVHVTNAKTMNLMLPENMDGSVDRVYLFVGDFGNRSFIAPLYFTSDSQGMYISILNDLGTSLAELSFSETGVDFDSELLPGKMGKMKAEYIVSDIQAAFYNVDALKDHYRNSGLLFETHPAGNGEVRVVMDGKKVIMTITKDENIVCIKNFLRGYSYELTGAQDDD
ncbi:MAG: DUF3261 domain-containing protein [Treponema sp.]|nr:DUF3261 domain-containing protein [Treponema sp.]